MNTLLTVALAAICLFAGLALGYVAATVKRTDDVAPRPVPAPTLPHWWTVSSFFERYGDEYTGPVQVRLRRDEQPRPAWYAADLGTFTDITNGQIIDPPNVLAVAI